uniref:Uncharacterized protein n=1 Tax=viral metagenome TaxID=1070528 RepID=A0A6C0KQ48_9ZZZZ
MTHLVVEILADIKEAVKAVENIKSLVTSAETKVESARKSLDIRRNDLDLGNKNLAVSSNALTNAINTVKVAKEEEGRRKFLITNFRPEVVKKTKDVEMAQASVRDLETALQEAVSFLEFVNPADNIEYQEALGKVKEAEIALGLADVALITVLKNQSEFQNLLDSYEQNLVNIQTQLETNEANQLEAQKDFDRAQQLQIEAQAKYEIALKTFNELSGDLSTLEANGAAENDKVLQAINDLSVKTILAKKIKDLEQTVKGLELTVGGLTAGSSEIVKRVTHLEVGADDLDDRAYVLEKKVDFVGRSKRLVIPNIFSSNKWDSPKL